MGFVQSKLKSYFQPPYVWLLLLSLLMCFEYLAAIFNVSLVQIQQVPNSEFIAWSRAATISLFGSYLVVILVNKSHHDKEERDRQRVEEIALEELSGTINRHLGLLGEWYVSASAGEPDQHPCSFNELLAEDFYQTIRWLDFSKKYPTMPQRRTWAEHNGEELSSMRNDINQVLDRYGPFMRPKLVSDLQKLASSDLTGFLIGIGETNIVEFDKAQGIERDYMLFVGAGVDQLVSSHIMAVTGILEYYERTEYPDLTSISDHGLWRDDIAPRVGDSRGETNPDCAEPRVGAGAGAPPSVD